MNEKEFPQQISNGGFDDDASHFDMVSLNTEEPEFVSDSLYQEENQFQIPIQNANIHQIVPENISHNSISITPQKIMSKSSSIPLYSSYNNNNNHVKFSTDISITPTTQTYSSSPPNIEENQPKIAIPTNIPISPNTENIMMPLSNPNESIEMRTIHKTCCSKFAWFCSKCCCDFENTIFQATQRTDQSIRKATSECHRWIDNYFYNNCNTPK